jgi:hypothetical protein
MIYEERLMSEHIHVVCEKCRRDLGMGRTIKLIGGEEIQCCTTCQRALDHWLETHPAAVAYIEAAKMLDYWRAQAHWRQVEHEYVLAMRTAQTAQQSLRTVINAWLATPATEGGR